MTQLVPPQPGIPLPTSTIWSEPFWDGCRRGELLYQRCRSCGAPVFNPAPACRACQSTELEWQRSAGLGTVYSWTVAWRPQSPAFGVPYAAVIVDLAEGYQMISNLVGCDTSDARVGLAVEVEFHDVGEGISLPCFRPAR